MRNIGFHHEGTKDTKDLLGCASRTRYSRIISRKARQEREGIDRQISIFATLASLARGISESEYFFAFFALFAVNSPIFVLFVSFVVNESDRLSLDGRIEFC